MMDNKEFTEFIQEINTGNIINTCILQELNIPKNSSNVNQTVQASIINNSTIIQQISFENHELSKNEEEIANLWIEQPDICLQKLTKFYRESKFWTCEKIIDYIFKKYSHQITDVLANNYLSLTDLYDIIIDVSYCVDKPFLSTNYLNCFIQNLIEKPETTNQRYLLSYFKIFHRKFSNMTYDKWAEIYSAKKSPSRFIERDFNSIIETYKQIQDGVIPCDLNHYIYISYYFCLIKRAKDMIDYLFNPTDDIFIIKKLEKILGDLAESNYFAFANPNLTECTFRLNQRTIEIMQNILFNKRFLPINLDSIKKDMKNRIVPSYAFCCLLDFKQNLLKYLSIENDLGLKINYVNKCEQILSEILNIIYDEHNNKDIMEKNNVLNDIYHKYYILLRLLKEKRKPGSIRQFLPRNDYSSRHYYFSLLYFEEIIKFDINNILV